MNKNNKLLLKLSSYIASAFLCITQLSYVAYAEELSYSTSSESAELEPGYYEEVTIDGSKIYAKGYSDGLNHTTFTDTFSTIIVDPGAYGMFLSDNTTDAKTFKGSSTAGVDLGVTAASDYSDCLLFSGWDVSVSNKILTLTAKFQSKTSYNYTGSVQKWLCTESGTYKLTVAGAGNGNTQHGGGLMIGTMYIEAGTLLYVYVGGSGELAANGYAAGGFNGGGGGTSVSAADNVHGGAGATDIRVGGNSLDDRVIVGGGGGGGAAWGDSGSSYGGYPSGGKARHYTGSEPYGGNSTTAANTYANPGTQTSGYSLGVGQTAGSRASGSYGAAWGGGGGGYYGGYATSSSGASSSCAGGGGSSYYKSGTVELVSYQNGYQSSNGMAKIEKVE